MTKRWLHSDGGVSVLHCPENCVGTDVEGSPEGIVTVGRLMLHVFFLLHTCFGVGDIDL